MTDAAGKEYHFACATEQIQSAWILQLSRASKLSHGTGLENLCNLNKLYDKREIKLGSVDLSQTAIAVQDVPPRTLAREFAAEGAMGDEQEEQDDCCVAGVSGLVAGKVVLGGGHGKLQTLVQEERQRSLQVEHLCNLETGGKVDRNKPEAAGEVHDRAAIEEAAENVRLAPSKIDLGHHRAGAVLW